MKKRESFNSRGGDLSFGLHRLGQLEWETSGCSPTRCVVVRGGGPPIPGISSSWR